MPEIGCINVVSIASRSFDGAIRNGSKTPQCDTQNATNAAVMLSTCQELVQFQQERMSSRANSC